jgi:hypothetical protein
MECMMDEKFHSLDLYLENTQTMLNALHTGDLEAADRCLAVNFDIMKKYEQIKQQEGGLPRKRALKEKIESIMQAHHRCESHVEKKCREIKAEIEATEKNRQGLRKYGGRQAYTPKFVDNHL